MIDDIASLAKTRTDSRVASLFGPAIVGVLRRTNTVAHRIGAMVMAPRHDGSAPREEYLDLFVGLDKANRDFIRCGNDKMHCLCHCQAPGRRRDFLELISCINNRSVLAKHVTVKSEMPRCVLKALMLF